MSLEVHVEKYEKVILADEISKEYYSLDVRRGENKPVLKTFWTKEELLAIAKEIYRAFPVCKNGHEINKENMRILGGKKVCYACRRDREKRKNELHRSVVKESTGKNNTVSYVYKSRSDKGDK
jgi:hypothetical protein